MKSVRSTNYSDRPDVTWRDAQIRLRLDTARVLRKAVEQQFQARPKASMKDWAGTGLRQKLQKKVAATESLLRHLHTRIEGVGWTDLKHDIFGTESMKRKVTQSVGHLEREQQSLEEPAIICERRLLIREQRPDGDTEEQSVGGSQDDFQVALLQERCVLEQGHKMLSAYIDAGTELQEALQAAKSEMIDDVQFKRHALRLEKSALQFDPYHGRDRACVLPLVAEGKSNQKPWPLPPRLHTTARGAGRRRAMADDAPGDAAAASAVIDLVAEAKDSEEAAESPHAEESQRKGKGKGPPLPKPQARPVTPHAADAPAPVRTLRLFHFQRPPNLDRGGVIVMSNDPADRDLAILVRHLTDSGRHQKDIRIEHALLNLGRLRALRYERNQFNGAARSVDGQRFLEICSSCGVQAGERPARLEGLDDLITALEGEIEDELDLDEHRKDISLGRVQFNGLGEVFYPGEKVWMTIDGLSEPLGLTVLQSWYQLRSSLFGPEKSFHVEFEFLASVGNSFAKINFQEPFSSYQGVRRLDSLLYQLMTPEPWTILDDSRGRVTRHYARGSFYSHGRTKHAALSDGRVMLDTQKGQEYGHHAARGGDNCSLALQHAVKAYKLQQKLCLMKTVPWWKHGTDSLRLVAEPSTEELWMSWPALVGFSFTAKCWGQVLVAETAPIEFKSDAFEQLVLPGDTKEIIRSAVRHASCSGLDFIAGKGDNTIFLLYGPPGSGKTLTAEAIAEMLHMPLYVVTAGDLGISAQEVEQNLSQVLHLCSEWNALTLIDEADA
eukprot:g3530.t1